MSESSVLLVKLRSSLGGSQKSTSVAMIASAGIFFYVVRVEYPRDDLTTLPQINGRKNIGLVASSVLKLRMTGSSKFICKKCDLDHVSCMLYV